MSQQPRTPPMKTSDESDQKQLELARRQGDAIQAALDEMVKHEAQGKVKQAGDYLVALAWEHAEGMYSLHNGELMWHNPTDENIHIEVGVTDAGDHRFVPELDITVTVLSNTGEEIGTNKHPFLWHPWLYHYGRNWKLPEDGTYKVRVHIDAPTFMRHDKENGKRYAAPVDVEFDSLQMSLGQKLS